MELPLAKRIKKQSHRSIASAQDLIVETLLEYVPEAVFHGGTCIWRCHSGNRFSDDLDFYLPKVSLEKLFTALSKQFRVEKKKITERSVYSKLVSENTTVRLEGTFQEKGTMLLDYEKIDGNVITVLGLGKEELLKEKAITYTKRKKIRDLYDVFFLLKYVKAEEAERELKALLKNYTEPVDEPELKVLILQGLVPGSQKMHEYIKRKCQNI